MRTVRVRGQNAYAVFRNDELALRLGGENGLETVEQITALIFGENNRILAAGVAVKSPDDDIDYFEGSRLAFGRALQNLTADKDVRRKFWELYYETMGVEKLNNMRDEIIQSFEAGDFDPPPSRPAIGRDGVDYDFPYLGAGAGPIDPNAIQNFEVFREPELEAAIPQTGPFSASFVKPVDPQIERLERRLARYLEDHQTGVASQDSTVDCESCNDVREELARLRAVEKPVNPKIAELEATIVSLEADHANGLMSGPTSDCSSCNYFRKELADLRAEAA